MSLKKEYVVLGCLRISLGLLFLWAFFDKLLGLHFATPPDKSWIVGNSPTYGFLSKAVHGPLASFYHSLAGSAVVDWLFMLGLLCIGITLVLGIAVRLGSYTGVVLTFLMWTALLPPQNHPFIDEHIIYLFAFLYFSMTPVGKYLGLGTWWSSLPFIKKYPFFA